MYRISYHYIILGLHFILVWQAELIRPAKAQVYECNLYQIIHSENARTFCFCCLGMCATRSHNVCVVHRSPRRHEFRLVQHVAQFSLV